MTPQEQPEDGQRVVGHKTFRDGNNGFRHEPLTADEAGEIMKEIDAARERRAAAMPDERSAIDAMFEAWQRLKELGWKEAIYCPKDGTTFDAIEAGSSGIQTCYYEGKWPNGHWWVMDEGDLWPSRPILYRTSERKQLQNLV